MQEEIKSNGIILRKNLLQIGNRKVFLNSGEVHYFRISPEEWEDRLTKAKALGLNAISTDIFWSFHEEEQDKFDITSAARDLDHFLHLCENKGFYIIIRPGPWIGSDLKNGGVPKWVLEDHPKILKLDENFASFETTYQTRISYLSPTYLRIVEKYFDRLAHVLRRHLYPHGGLILLQIDNIAGSLTHQDLFEDDYNPVTIEYYKKFLREKYKDIESINTNYDQNFLSFDHIEPPNSKTQQEATHSENDFKRMGEFLRNMDWMECKERIIQEFIVSISYILRKKGVFLPYCVNVPFTGSPVNIRDIYTAYKTKIEVGMEIGEEFLFELDKKTALLEANIESYKCLMPLLNIVPECAIGHNEKVISPNFIHLLTRLVFGHGIKGVNYYMGVGGNTPLHGPEKKPYSILKKSLNFDGNALKIQDSGDFYDYGAPIGIQGQRNPSYEVIHHLSKYLRTNGESLLEGMKVYDEDIAILHYHPYSRLNFDTSKFGFVTNFLDYSHNSHPEFEPLHSLGIHPRWVDLQNITLKELQKHKIVVVLFSVFLDKISMLILKKYIQSGGIVVSFHEIPTRNEFMQLDDTLSSLYYAKLQKKENPKQIALQGKKFTAFQDIYSISLMDDINIESKNLTYDITASDNAANPKLVYGIHRSIEKGHIYHFSFTPTPDKPDIENLGIFLSTLKKTPQKTIHPRDITVLRLKCNNSGEIVSITNLTKNKLENVEITFNDVTMEDEKTTVQVSDITILPRSSSQWSINKKISQYAKVRVCTSELHEVFKRTKKDHVVYNISGFHFRGSRNRLEILLSQKPVKIISGKKDITKRVFQSDNKLRVQFSELEGKKSDLFKLSAIYSDDLLLSIHFQGKEKNEILNFNIKKMNTFLE